MDAAELPESLAANPVLGDWVRIRSDGVVEVRSGKVELGQGMLTALAQIAAEELDVDAARIQMIAAATDLSPDEGFTAGSRSIQQSGILRFSEVPAIDVELVAGQGNPPLGIGECAQGPTAAAIANAVCDAIGVRVRSLPLTADQLIAAMSD
jgi:CO/xanthine dehydrogenase Mo-binding subunit